MKEEKKKWWSSNVRRSECRHICCWHVLSAETAEFTELLFKDANEQTSVYVLQVSSISFRLKDAVSAGKEKKQTSQLSVWYRIHLFHKRVIITCSQVNVIYLYFFLKDKVKKRQSQKLRSDGSFSSRYICVYTSNQSAEYACQAGSRRKRWYFSGHIYLMPSEIWG